MQKYLNSNQTPLTKRILGQPVEQKEEKKNYAIKITLVNEPWGELLISSSVGCLMPPSVYYDYKHADFKIIGKRLGEKRHSKNELKKEA